MVLTFPVSLTNRAEDSEAMPCLFRFNVTSRSKTSKRSYKSELELFRRDRKSADILKVIELALSLDKESASGVEKAQNPNL